MATSSETEQSHDQAGITSLGNVGSAAPAPRPLTAKATTQHAPAAGSWQAKMESYVSLIAAADISVLVHGETGSGKEVLARQVHANSSRARNPFLKVNCAALPSELVESELFGYHRGAFTGAFKTNPGKFELADTGTIFLDEIGDMDLKTQAKLLQVLQDGEFLPLGASESRRVNVRVVAATHCDLERAVEERRFREDLFYRLNIVTIIVPPLRERAEEILPLANHFLKKHANSAEVPVICADLAAALEAHDWPGNVRELENVMRKLLVIRDAELTAAELRTRTRRRVRSIAAVEPQRTFAPAAPTQAMTQPCPVCEALRTSQARELPGPLSPPSVLEQVDEARRQAEAEVIIEALNATRWNRKRAAAMLSIDYKALLYKMKKLGIGEDEAQQIAV